MTLNKKVFIGYIITMIVFVAIFFLIPRVTENPTQGMERLGLMVLCARIVTIMAAAYFLVDLVLAISQKRKVYFQVALLLFLSTFLYFLYN